MVFLYAFCMLFRQEISLWLARLGEIDLVDFIPCLKNWNCKNDDFWYVFEWNWFVTDPLGGNRPWRFRIWARIVKRQKFEFWGLPGPGGRGEGFFLRILSKKLWKTLEFSHFSIFQFLPKFVPQNFCKIFSKNIKFPRKMLQGILKNFVRVGFCGTPSAP